MLNKSLKLGSTYIPEQSFTRLCRRHAWRAWIRFKRISCSNLRVIDKKQPCSPYIARNISPTTGSSSCAGQVSLLSFLLKDLEVPIHSRHFSSAIQLQHGIFLPQEFKTPTRLQGLNHWKSPPPAHCLPTEQADIDTERDTCTLNVISTYCKAA